MSVIHFTWNEYVLNEGQPSRIIDVYNVIFVLLRVYMDNMTIVIYNGHLKHTFTLKQTLRDPCSSGIESMPCLLQTNVGQIEFQCAPSVTTDTA